MTSLDARKLHVRVLDALLRVPGAAGVKPGILRRTAQKLARAILESRVSSTDPVHFGTLDLIHRLNEVDDRHARELLLAVGRYALRGRVIPIQRLHVVLDEARAVYLARCPCRASGRVREEEGRETAEGRKAGFTAETPRSPRHTERRQAVDGAALADPLLQAWRDPAVRAATSPRLAEALERAATVRREGTARKALDELWRVTWPYWEILVEHPGFDRAWLHGLSKNRKVWRVHPRLIHPWIDAMYRDRGVVFTHMEAAGLPYAICSCPGPEADGGCMLTNWHYFSDNDEILLPNVDQAHGRRRDAAGAPLPCRKHEARRGRPCLGCGCDHEREEGGRE
ncbi:MAG: hypothetical protein HY907_07245 [Deltaproteobacteria bacterium]|nr:hypothetical protein [Deltaproteobacteria bacterium]